MIQSFDVFRELWRFPGFPSWLSPQQEAAFQEGNPAEGFLGFYTFTLVLGFPVSDVAGRISLKLCWRFLAFARSPRHD